MNDEHVQHQVELLRNLRREHADLAELVGALTPQQMTTPGIHGDGGSDGWTVKDVLSHLTWWEQSVFGWLGRPPAVVRTPIPEGELTDDQANAAIFAGNKDRDLAEVLHNFEHSYQQLIAAVEEASEDQLGQPRATDPGGTPIWELAPANTYEHYREHLGAIHAWLQGQHAEIETD